MLRTEFSLGHEAGFLLGYRVPLAQERGTQLFFAPGYVPGHFCTLVNNDSDHKRQAAWLVVVN